MTQVSTLGKLAVVTAGVLGIATACGSTSTPSTSSSSSTSGKIGGSVTVWAEWTAQEQHDFLASLAPFESATGITVNYQGKGNKTIVPAWASAKITCRLVPDQSPAKIRRLVCDQLKKICPPTVRLEIEAGHGAEAYLVSPTGTQAQAALRALKNSFGSEPILMREGGSIPIVNQFKKILGADSLLLGLGLPDDNAHSPNEKFNLDCFVKGQLMSVYLWQELSRAQKSV